MKKISNFLYLLAVMMMASCTDFLEKSPNNTVDTETDVTDDVAIALTTACYRTLQFSNMYNQRIWTLDIVAGNSEVDAGGGPTDWKPHRQPTSLRKVKRYGTLLMAFTVGRNWPVQHRAQFRTRF